MFDGCELLAVEVALWIVEHLVEQFVHECLVVFVGLFDEPLKGRGAVVWISAGIEYANDAGFGPAGCPCVKSWQCLE